MKHRAWCASVLFCLLIAGLTVPAWAAAVPKSAGPTGASKAQNASARMPEEAKAQLDAAARVHLERVTRTLLPNLANKEVTRQGPVFVARYLVVDADRMTTELVNDRIQSSAHLGNVIYVVHEYQCTGATRQEALNGPFQKVKSRRVREFTRYADGKWQF